MSGQDIYDNFTGSSLMGLVYGADSVSQIAASYANRASSLRGMLAGLTRDWDSTAGEAAHRAAQPLTNEHVIAAPQIENAARSMQHQAQIFESARHAVVPIPPLPRQPGLWDNFIFGEAVAKARYEQQVADYQAANDHNIKVMEAYEAATQDNLATLTVIPQVLNPTPGPGTPPAPPSPGPAPLPWRVPPGGDGSGGGSGAGGSTPSPTQPNVQTPTSPPLPGRPVPGETHADSAQPLTPRPTQLDITLPKPAQPGPTPGGSGLPIGPIAGGSGSGADPGRSGSRGFGPGGGHSGRGEAGAHPGGRGAGGLGARGPEHALGRGGGAGRAGGGWPGGGTPMGGGARPNGGEDIERQRPSFLVDPDPDDTFGTDEVTAPPVIGG